MQSVPRVTPETYEAGKYLPVTFKPDTQPKFWTVVGGASMVLDTDNPLNEFLNVSLKLDASSASAASPAGVANGGYWGIPVKPHDRLSVSFFAKAAAGFTGPATVSIESADGKTTFASAEISGLSTEWKKFETKLKTENIPASKENRLQTHHQDSGNAVAAKRLALPAHLQESRERQSRRHHGVVGRHEARVPPIPRRQLS